MSSNGDELALKFGIDSGDAEAGVKRVNDALDTTKEKAEGAGDAGEKAGKKVGDGAAAATPQAQALAAAEEQLAAKLSKLETAGTPKALIKGAVDAKGALKEYETAAKAAGVATETLNAKMTSAGASIQGAASKAALLKQEMIAMRTQGGLAAEGMVSLGGRASSLSGMLALAKQTGTGLTKTMGEIGLGAMAVTAGVNMAIGVGEKLSEWTVSGIDRWSAYDVKMVDTGTASNKLSNALKAVGDGLIPMGKNVDQLSENYRLLGARMNSAGVEGQALEAEIGKFAGSKDIKQLDQQASKLAGRWEGVFRGGAELAGMYVPVMLKHLGDLAARYAAIGKTMPEAMLALQKELAKTASAQRLLSEDTARSAIDAEAKIQLAQRQTVQAAEENYQKTMKTAAAKLKALNDEQLSDEEYTRRKRELNDEIDQAIIDQAAVQAKASKDNINAQGELQHSLKLTDGAMQQLIDAAGEYVDRTEGAEGAMSGFDDKTKQLLAMLREPVSKDVGLEGAVAGLQKSLIDTGETVPIVTADLSAFADNALHGSWVAADELGEKVRELQKQLLEGGVSAGEASNAVNIFGAAMDENGKKVENFTLKVRACARAVTVLKNQAAITSGTAGADATAKPEPGEAWF